MGTWFSVLCQKSHWGHMFAQMLLAHVCTYLLNYVILHIYIHAYGSVSHVGLFKQGFTFGFD